jgi:hypothetical protein
MNLMECSSFWPLGESRATGYWLLAPGFWFLVFGFWFLDSGEMIIFFWMLTPIKRAGSLLFVNSQRPVASSEQPDAI